LSSTTPYEKCRPSMADWGRSNGYILLDLVVPNRAEKIVPSDTLNRRIPDLISLTWPRQPQAISLSSR
ncbi:MAG: hypothetical protein GX599_04800, partial [Chloroflexi bacterium]|nr:hypothetical protein [Chloroflexota bacterium]